MQARGPASSPPHAERPCCGAGVSAERIRGVAARKPPSAPLCPPHPLTLPLRRLPARAPRPRHALPSRTGRRLLIARHTAASRPPLLRPSFPLLLPRNPTSNAVHLERACQRVLARPPARPAVGPAVTKVDHRLRRGGGDQGRRGGGGQGRRRLDFVLVVACWLWAPPACDRRWKGRAAPQAEGGSRRLGGGW